MTPSTYDGVDAVWIFAKSKFHRHACLGSRVGFLEGVDVFSGFLGTLLTMMVVEKGSERAYGIDMPRKPTTPCT